MGFNIKKAAKDQHRAATSSPSGHLKESLDPGGIMRGAAKSSPIYDSKSGKNLKKSNSKISESNKANKGTLAEMSKADSSYSQEMAAASKEYQKNIDRLGDASREQGKSAEATYSNDIQPRLKGVMEDAQKQAGMAMSLEEAGDPNNKIQQSVRDLYDQQAKGVRKQGLQDVGVLSALGAQATAGQMGAGGPMTGSQMQLLSANNQAQGGQAYARTQKQMQDLRNQGLERGFSESAAQYQRGEGARDRYQGSIAGYEGGMDRNISRQAGFRGEQAGYAGQLMSDKGGLSGLQHGLQTGGLQRQMQQNNNYYGQQQGNIQQQMQVDQAQRSAYQNVLMPSASYGGMGTSGASGAQNQGAPQQNTAATNQGQQNQATAQNDPYRRNGYA